MAASNDKPPAKPHRWTFARIGSVDQVLLKSGIDLERLPELDLKLWMTLAMPAAGLECDPKTLQLLDADHDGRIRPPELLAALAWAKTAFTDLDQIIKGGDAISLSAIKDPVLLAAAKGVLGDLGRPDAEDLSLADLTAYSAGLAKRKFNGDGIITPDTAGDDAVARRAIEDMLRVLEGVTDRSGKAGLDQAMLDGFKKQAADLLEWADAAPTDAERAPLGLEKTQAAWVALQEVRVKVDDYFMRCSLAAFDPAAGPALTPVEQDYRALASRDLSMMAHELEGLPLAKPGPNQPLPLDGGVNPAWSARIATLATQAVAPLLEAGKDVLAEKDWLAVKDRLAPYESLIESKPNTPIEALGLARVRELAAAPVQEALAELMKKDLGPAAHDAKLPFLDKLLRFKRDLYVVITNYVNFADFYGRTWAVFQAGTLYLDARACYLCIEVTDITKHAALAGLSNAFLAYCDVTRKDGQKKNILAVITDGDSDNLMVGRNGVFYDRQGMDWDATITRIVSNPISVREAFWMPYKKLVRFIEDQIEKRAQTAEQGTADSLSSTAETIVAADKAKTPAGLPKKLDLGAIALIGTAIGGVSALVGGFLQALFGLGFWLPLGVIGLILLVSGPSMILAWLKLRQRNLAPILDANGWAMNTRARVNVPFGASLTALARLPRGSARILNDPFADARRPWKKWLGIVAILALVGYGWFLGWFDRYLPKQMRAVPANEAPANNP